MFWCAHVCDRARASHAVCECACICACVCLCVNLNGDRRRMLAQRAYRVRVHSIHYRGHPISVNCIYTTVHARCVKYTPCILFEMLCRVRHEANRAAEVKRRSEAEQQQKKEAMCVEVKPYKLCSIGSKFTGLVPHCTLMHIHCTYRLTAVNREGYTGLNTYFVCVCVSS